MRLICPNCGAQYEVPAEVIPAGGRDVQCSNCGHTWFQSHPDDDPALAEELGEPAPSEQWSPEQDRKAQAAPSRQDADNDWSDDAAPEADFDPAEDFDTAEDSGPATDLDAAADEDDDEEAPRGARPPEPPRRSLDPNVAGVLREEAEREARARARAAEGLESQPELGLDDVGHEDEVARRAREARERMARIRGEQIDAEKVAAAAAAASGSRKGLLPDIEEINSTLRASSEPRGLETPQGTLADEPSAASGFSRGFISMLLLMVVLIALYALSDSIENRVPALSGAMDAYVAQVDALRVWLSGLTEDLLAWLDGMSSESAE